MTAIASMTHSTPEITAPAAASHRPEPFRRAAPDAMKAAGVDVRMAHFDKVQIPSCQPGWSHDMRPMIAHGTSERQKPAVPRRFSEVLST
jgi:hypothetical protein